MVHRSVQSHNQDVLYILMYIPLSMSISHVTLEGGLVPMVLVDVTEKVICVHIVSPQSKLNA